MLAMSSLEPLIAENLAESTQARMIAESRLESAYDQILTTVNLITILAGTTAA